MKSMLPIFFFAFLYIFAVPIVHAELGRNWQSIEPASAGWSVEELKAAQDYAATLKATSVMIVQDGKVIVSWGDIFRKVNVASVRKAC